jgi:uncharacterized Zn finger protein
MQTDPPTQARLLTVSCSACSKRFQAIVLSKTSTMKCTHCGEAYFLHNDTWQNEKLRKIILGKKAD